MGRCRAEGVAGNPLASHLRFLSMPSLYDLTLTTAFFSSPSPPRTDSSTPALDPPGHRSLSSLATAAVPTLLFASPFSS